MLSKGTLKAVVFSLLLVFCFLPTVQPSIALTLGICFALLAGNPFHYKCIHYSRLFLKASVIGLGFNINTYEILQIGTQAVWFTIIAIVLSMIMGLFLGRMFNIEKNTAILITTGTSICGGSAIAAMSPAIKAESYQTAASLATIFIFNGLALILFPTLGRFFDLSEETFGVWAALSIHDTSSVAGAIINFGEKASTLGLTVKLTRALWILPITFLVSYFYHGKSKAHFPFFLLGFIFASSLNSSLPQLSSFWHILSLVAKQILTLSLFLIGSTITKDLLRKVGTGPLLQGFILWFLISIFSLFAIILGWIPIPS